MPPPEQKARGASTSFSESWLGGPGPGRDEPERRGRRRRPRVPAAVGPCDYLLFVDRKAAGVVEAKPEGQTLTGVAEQAETSCGRCLSTWRRSGRDLLFDYESTGTETLFRDVARPRRALPPRVRVPPAGNAARLGDRARHVARPAWSPAAARSRAFANARSRPSPASASSPGWRRRSPAATRARSSRWRPGPARPTLACTFIYRLIKYAGARRVLFLVDRNNLGDQALRSSSTTSRRTTRAVSPALYVVQHLKTNTIDKDAKVVITTIQRLYSMLRGEELRRGRGAVGVRERRRRPAQGGRLHAARPDRDLRLHRHRRMPPLDLRPVAAGPRLLRCLHHRPDGDALAAHPRLLQPQPGGGIPLRALGHRRRQRRLRGLPRPDADHRQGGASTPATKCRSWTGSTRRKRYEELDADLDYTARSSTARSPCPTRSAPILEVYRDRLFTDLFPDRHEVPKTLIFAKDDTHAEDDHEIARQVFGTATTSARRSPSRRPRTRRRSSRRSATTRCRGSWSRWT